MSAHRALVRIDLDEDVVLSARSATTGDHEGLDYIPGNALLGLVASRLGGTSFDRWRVLHSGKVRFGNALPYSDDHGLARPMPVSLHAPKSKESRFNPENVFNLAAGGGAPTGIQLTPHRQGFLTADLTYVAPARSLRLKTAIDSDRGVAREAMLFGLNGLAQGQSFVAEIEADAGCFADDEAGDRDAFDQLVALFATEQGRSARIGRSRSGEYGAVTIRRLTLRPVEGPEQASGDIRIWCLSDVELADDWGQPSFTPRAADFGLEGGEFLAERSFIQTRSYQPFNSRWEVNDLERQVIKAGTVITFSNVKRAQRGRRRVGLNQAAGLGHVDIDPVLLRNAGISAEDPVLLDRPPEAKVAAPLSASSEALFGWMTSRYLDRVLADGTDRQVLAFVERLVSNYEKADAYLGAREDGLAGPGRSQWHAVARIAADYGRKLDAGEAAGSLVDALFGKGKAVPPRDAAWDWKVGPGHSHADLLRAEVEKCENDKELDAARLVALVADRMSVQVGDLKIRAGEEAL